MRLAGDSEIYFALTNSIVAAVAGIAFGIAERRVCGVSTGKKSDDSKKKGVEQIHDGLEPVGHARTIYRHCSSITHEITI